MVFFVTAADIVTIIGCRQDAGTVVSNAAGKQPFAAELHWNIPNCLTGIGFMPLQSWLHK
jgi:hypothetical protein